MTDSENSQPQDESDDDIYKDIPEFNFEDELAKLEGSKETYKQEVSDLSEKVKVLTEENKELRKSNEVLKKNLSTLLKTAQAEVQRKDSMIEELRTKVDSFTFRRNKTSTKDKYTSTDEFKFNYEEKNTKEKQGSLDDKKRSKSHENRSSSESEQRLSQEKEKPKEPSAGKEENSNCDNGRRSSHSRKNSNTNFSQSDNSHDRQREKKSNRYEGSSEYRRSYRKDHKDHLKSDSFDKKRHSRSSDSRFLSRHRHSRERKSDRRRRDSGERRRSEESSERSRRRKQRSRSREISRGSKEPSLEKYKRKSSRDKDSVGRAKEQINNKSEDVEKSCEGADRKKPKTENCQKRNSQDDPVGKFKQSREKRKQEKRSSLETFTAKSPLDALYNEMVSSRSINRFCNSKTGTVHPDSDLEEGELSSTLPTNEGSSPSETQPQEDWTLSFKNERKNDTKPMTLYSRRMLRKFSSEVKTTEIETNKKEESKQPPDCLEKSQEMEREPGELTDDENLVESSKEFQELAKAASIEIVEKPATEVIFKEPIRKETFKGEMTTANSETKETEKMKNGREEKEVETDKETRDVIEFSPFKNNYKLIEISPIKPGGSSEHILDFYNQRAPPTEAQEPTTGPDSSLTESEKSTNKTTDTSDEKNSERELKIVIPPSSGSPKENEKKRKEKEEESKKKKEKTEEGFGRGKRKQADRQKEKKETGKPTREEKNQKRKRKSSETDPGNSDVKKRKLEKEEAPQKKSRSKRNLKNQPEPEPKVKEDISNFEFFKPVAKTDIPQTPVDPGKIIATTTDYKMTATMSVTGVVRLETPDKCMEKVKNLTINEHMIFNVLDSKNSSQFSPLIGSKLIEMTPRRMLKNDLMLTDSEDDSICQKNPEAGEDEEAEDKEVGEEEEESSPSENSECDSDSGASDFVDLL